RRRRRFGRGRIWLCLRRKGEAARPEKGDNNDDTAHSELNDPTPFVQEAGDTRNIPATYQSNGKAKAGVATATELALGTNGQSAEMLLRLLHELYKVVFHLCVLLSIDVDHVACVISRIGDTLMKFRIEIQVFHRPIGRVKGRRQIV